jgi:hypothetical protein
MFTGFSPWDDDGYVLIGIRSLLHGRRLYDDIYSQYGPFYYLVHWIVYSAFRQPVSHDVERFIGVVLWLLSAILWARVVYLLTRSPVWAALAFFLATKLLQFFPWSAGHPEEICMALLSALAVIACGLSPMRAGRGAAALAAVVAALALTKVNIGLYLAIAIGLILLKATPPTRFQRFALLSLSCAGIVLPVALMSPLLGFSWTRIYCFTATLLIGATIVLADGASPRSFLTGRIWWIAALSFMGSVLLVTFPFFFHGTSFRALLYMTVLQHAGFARNFYVPALVGRKSLLMTGFSLVLLVAVCLRKRRSATRELAPDSGGAPASDWIGAGLLGIKTAAGLGCAVAVVGLNVNAALFIFKYCTPFIWLVLLHPAEATAEEPRAGRFALCVIAAFTYLYAFPVAGNQLGFASVPVAIVSLLLLRDGTQGIAKFFPAELPYRRALRIAPALASLLILALFLHELRSAYRSYTNTNSASLGMPGAERIRVTRRTAGVYRWIKQNLDSCQAIYSMPGLFSLYFWTAKEPPTDLTAGDSIGLLNEAQQRTVANDLSRYRGMCIVYSPALVEFWRRGQDLSRSPLLHYIQTEFTRAASYDGYFIMKRK